MNVNNSLTKVSDLRENLRQFISADNILGTLSGVTIAIAAGKMITSFVSDIIFPTIYYLLKYKSSGEFSPIKTENFSRFGKEFISFSFVVLITFVFVKYVLEFLFDIKGKKKDISTGPTPQEAPQVSAPTTTPQESQAPTPQKATMTVSAQQLSAQQLSAQQLSAQAIENIYAASSIQNESFFGGSNFAAYK